MAFDFKKEYKEFYMPKAKPEIVNVPSANYIAVRGCGDPNEEGGAYKQAIGLLYTLAFTIKMSYKGDHKIAGYYEYVVPPLEGFWWQDGVDGVDFQHKETFQWISVIRLPDFVTKEDLEWAVEEASRKKNHGPFDEEPVTIALMDAYLAENGYCNDFSDTRMHHEIYLSDARRVVPEKWRTVIRHPIRKV